MDAEALLQLLAGDLVRPDLLQTLDGVLVLGHLILPDLDSPIESHYLPKDAKEIIDAGERIYWGTWITSCLTVQIEAVIPIARGRGRRPRRFRPAS